VGCNRFSAQWLDIALRLVMIPVGDAGGHDGSDAVFRLPMIPVGDAGGHDGSDAVFRLPMIPVGDAGGHDGSDGFMCQVSDLMLNALPPSRPSSPRVAPTGTESGAGSWAAVTSLVAGGPTQYHAWP
jgi:hypothetical protein